MRVTEHDSAGIAALQSLLVADPETWALLEGAPPRPDEARELVASRPPGVPPERKLVWITWSPDATTPDGVIDLVDGYPDPRTWYLGLIFLAPGARGTGLGAALLRALAEYARARGGGALRLAVTTANTGARRLYDRLGFGYVARRSRTLWTGATQACDVLELRLG